MPIWNWRLTRVLPVFQAAVLAAATACTRAPTHDPLAADPFTATAAGTMLAGDTTMFGGVGYRANVKVIQATPPSVLLPSVTALNFTADTVVLETYAGPCTVRLRFFASA